ncbi:hypothetical protein TNCV_4450431 [Trichonephila clavipes]|nr:hypothetical protein TNCV_4450431 [Trichonephila clavipes]
MHVPLLKPSLQLHKQNQSTTFLSTMIQTKLSGATGLLFPSQYVILDAEVYEQIFRSVGRSDVKPPCQASLVLIYRPTDERLNQPCPARDLNPQPVAWKRVALPLATGLQMIYDLA